MPRRQVRFEFHELLGPCLEAGSQGGIAGNEAVGDETVEYERPFRG
jgi:hypothetical protein